MKGERAEIRYKAERHPAFLEHGRTRRYDGKKWYLRPYEHKALYITYRFDTHADAACYVVNQQLQLEPPPKMPYHNKYTGWKLYELKLISWDGNGNQTIEHRSLE